MASEVLATAVLDALPDATAVVDPTGKIIAVNHTWRMFSVDNDGDEVNTGLGVDYLDVCRRAAGQGCADAEVAADGLRAVLAGDRVEAETEYACPSPTVGRWFMLRTTRLLGAQDGAVLSHVNITRRKVAEDELSHSASHDPLSGLANRSLVMTRLLSALALRQGRGVTPDVGLIFIDLDGFKAINDTFGHAAGDEVLLTVAHRLRTVVRPDAVVARLGGDEFLVHVPRVGRDALTALASRIDQTLAEPHRIHGHDALVPGSVGAHLATAGDTTEQAMECADQAMYAVKQARSKTSP
jgi:diguanylate cyclase (GGDEF)-like protein